MGESRREVGSSHNLTGIVDIVSLTSGSSQSTEIFDLKRLAGQLLPTYGVVIAVGVSGTADHIAIVIESNCKS